MSIKTLHLVIATVAITTVSSLDAGVGHARAAELDRLFVGVPNQLTVPPCFPGPGMTPCATDCDSAKPDTALDDQHAEQERVGLDDSEPKQCVNARQPPSQEKGSLVPESGFDADTTSSQARSREAH